MLRTRVARAALAGLALAASPGRAQTPTAPLPQSAGLIVANTGNYESIYGQPVYYSLELLSGLNGSPDAMAPSNKSVITRGVFVVHPNPRLCTADGNHCLHLEPVPEMSRDFLFQAESRAGDLMEVTGAFQGTQILMWSFMAGQAPPRAADAKDVPLEWLIHDPQRFAGRTILARGSFRGRNLFAEMPAESALTAEDWVLADGPFFVWITGKGPRGRGFALDPQSRADAVQRLEVEGRVDVKNGLVYVRAKDVRLIGRAGARTAEDAPP